MHLRLEGCALSVHAIRRLLALHVDDVRGALLQAVGERLRVAMVSRSTDHIVRQTVLVTLAQGDVAHLIEAAPSSDKHLHDLLVTIAGRLDNVGRPTILNVTLRMPSERWNFLRRVVQVTATSYERLDHFVVLAVDGRLHELTSIYLHVHLVDEDLGHGGRLPTQRNKLAHRMANIFWLHHYDRQKRSWLISAIQIKLSECKIQMDIFSKMVRFMRSVRKLRGDLLSWKF